MCAQDSRPLRTPREDGFRMPGEFEPHAGCWMAWPTRPDNWHDDAGPARRQFAAVAREIARHEPVTMLATRESYASARGMLADAVRVVEMSYDDAWMRDIGPTFVVDRSRALRGVAWRFNAWGGLYPDWRQDAAVARKVCELERTPAYQCPLVLEGGAVHVDGQGTCVTTEECLLNPNRNPGLTKPQIERELRAYLNVDKVIWLTNGVVGDDDTSGHVDNLCCFVRPGVLALTWTDDPRDPQYARSEDAYQRLSRASDARGRSLQVHKVRQPAPMHVSASEAASLDGGGSPQYREAGKRLAASYVNFYIANGAVIMPAFDDPADAAAMRVIGSLFRGRDIVQVSSREILLGGGNIHCITQQQPLGRA